jgi:hypothetical protein
MAVAGHARSLRDLCAEHGEDDDALGQATVPTLVALIDSTDTQVVTDVVAAVGSLAVEPPHRSALREAGAIPKIVSLLVNRGKGPLQAEAAGAIVNLAHDVANQDALRRAGAIPPLVKLLRSGFQNEMTSRAAQALCNMSHDHAENRDAVRQAGGIPPLVELLGAGTHSEAAHKAAGALCNLSCDNDENKDAIRESGGIAPLVALLSAGASSKAAVRAADALYNLSVDNHTNRCPPNASYAAHIRLDPLPFTTTPSRILAQHPAHARAPRAARPNLTPPTSTTFPPYSPTCQLACVRVARCTDSDDLWIVRRSTRTAASAVRCVCSHAQARHQGSWRCAPLPRCATASYQPAIVSTPSLPSCFQPTAILPRLAYASCDHRHGLPQESRLANGQRPATAQDQRAPTTRPQQLPVRCSDGRGRLPHGSHSRSLSTTL